MIFDATNLNRRSREPLLPIARRRAAGMLLVGFTAPAGVVRRRLVGRAMGRDPKDLSDADWSVYQQLRPYAEAFPRSSLLVDSSRDIGPAVEEVLGRIASLEGRAAAR